MGIEEEIPKMIKTPQQNIPSLKKQTCSKNKKNKIQ